MAIKDFGEVRTDHFHFDPSKTNLLFFGNIVANKRLDLLIQAVQSLPEKAASKYTCTYVVNVWKKISIVK